MASEQQQSGGCLCGAVRFTATPADNEVGTCHCSMCRRWTAGPFMVRDCGTTLKVEDETKIGAYRSSEWAERGFCATCGSTLWYGTVADGARHPAAGLFDDLHGAQMKIEFYADMCPDGYALAGDHRRMSTGETAALFAPAAKAGA